MNMPMPLPSLLLLLFGFSGAAAVARAGASEPEPVPAPAAPPLASPRSPAPAKAPVLCTIPKSGGEGSFYVVAAPNVTCPKAIRVNEPVYAILECTTGARTATCEAWPRVYAVNPGDEERLQYEWAVRIGWNTTHHPINSNPTISFHCPGIEVVSVTVRVSNGTASDLDFTGFRCGDDPR